MRSRTVLFFVCLCVWLGLTWPIDIQHFIVGIPVALFVTLITGDMFITRPHRLKFFIRYLWFFYYVPVFLWECFKANIDVAYRVGHPDVPIKPGIVKVKTSLKSDTGITFLANTITLTPGTLSVDVDQQSGCLYIHWINVKNKDMEKATKDIVGRFEPILARIFE